MNIQPGRVVVFVGVLLIIAVVIHNALKSDARGPATVQAAQAPVQPPPPVVAPAPAPTVTFTKIWPDGAIPTKVVHIPDPEQPVKGLMDINLRQGDDLELDFDPLWIFESRNADAFPGAQSVIDGGNSFQTFPDYERNLENSGTNAWWMKPRVVRLRLVPGRSDATYSITIEKREEERPLPPVPPQNFGDLSIVFDGLRRLPDRKTVVYLIFRNNSPANTIAVAMHDEPCTFLPCELSSSLLFSDGTPFVIYTSEITGINGIRSRPSLLTAIEPGQALRASFKFEPRGIVARGTSSARLQAEVVVNPNYQPDEYRNFPETGKDFLPPGCQIINVMFDIPFRPTE